MEFVCPDPFATVRGANVLATVQAFQLVPATARNLLARHGLVMETLDDGRRIAVQSWLDALREIVRSVGEAKLRSVGANVVQTAPLPSTFRDVESVLLGLDDIYRLNHVGRVGRYICTRTGPTEIRIVCETPYPRAFERGLIEGITRHPILALGRRFDVIYEDASPGSDATCVIRVVSLS